MLFCSRVREPQEALSAGPIAPQISSSSARVAALQKRWDRLGAGLDLILTNGARTWPNVLGGASGTQARDYKGKEGRWLVTRIDSGVVSRVAELRGHERQAAERLKRRKTRHEERRVALANEREPGP
jgi:hypothetical protein